MDRIQKIEKVVAEHKDPRDFELAVPSFKAQIYIEYLLSEVKRKNEALRYYAELYRNIEQNILEGELISQWLRRQGALAEEALKEQ